MAFDIQFQYNNEPMNKISKTPQDVGNPISGVLRDESSIVDPIILVELEEMHVLSANYAYISEFHRWYYIRNWEAVRNGVWRVTMHTDVLKTFSEGILGSPCIVAKSSNRFNLMLNDGDYKCNQDIYVSTQKFPNGFDAGHGCYILTLLGEKTTTPPSSNS